MASSLFERYRPNIRELRNDLRTKKFPSQLFASFGIVGPAGTGRKTLGYRFGQMYGGVLEAVPPQYSYVSLFDRRVGRHYAVRNMQIFIRGYVIDQPAELPQRNPPYYVNEWERFCCLLFVFDMSNMQSLINTSEYLTTFRNVYEHLPECYLVGNKVDLRDPTGANIHEVDQRRAIFEASQLGTNFYECSAKFNINVQPLLDDILERAFRERN
ncbi:unnamed protein product [Larinioides sclopetarius]|uniref:Uncharacterized protein n=1 Tax=Larinioides sclopetarius TaxID=280406 RepID=A0AAV2BAF8_9ARAC